MRKKGSCLRYTVAVMAVLCLLLTMFYGFFGNAFAAGNVNTAVRHELCTQISEQALLYYGTQYSWQAMQAYGGVDTESSLEAMQGELYIQLHNLMYNTITWESTYTNLKQYWVDTDAAQNSCQLFLYSDVASTESTSREHVWPKSKASFYLKYGGCDMQHLRPENTAVNSCRNNRVMGNVRNRLDNYKTYSFAGKDVLYYSPADDLVEVNDNVKGDVARILLYVYVTWLQPNLCQDVEPQYLPAFDDDDDENHGTRVIESLDTLLDWCKNDPVDEWEMQRNDCVQSIQGNRNVFIDYPEYAWLLFDKDVPQDMETPSGNATDCEYTITAVSADGTQGSVSVKGSSIIAHPGQGYKTGTVDVYPQDSAVAEISGNTVRLKNITADCTVTVSFARLKQYTVTLVTERGRQTRTCYEEEGLVLPDGADGANRFLGWSAAEVARTENLPQYFAAGQTLIATGDCTLYALYYTPVNGKPAFDSPAHAVTATPVSWDGYYIIAVPESNALMSGVCEKTYATSIQGTFNGDTVTGYNAENVFYFARVGDYYSIKNNSGAYLKAEDAKKVAFDGSKTAVTASDTDYLWTITAEGITAYDESRGQLQFYAASPRFTTYTSRQKAVSLYAVENGSGFAFVTASGAQSNATQAVTPAATDKPGTKPENPLQALDIKTLAIIAVVVLVLLIIVIAAAGKNKNKNKKHKKKKN